MENTKNVSVIFFVSESEYPRLQAACPRDFPFTYAQFVQRVEEGISHMPKGVTIKKTYVDIAKFLSWCAETKVEPNNKARAAYAVFLYSSSQKS